MYRKKMEVNLLIAVGREIWYTGPELYEWVLADQVVAQEDTRAEEKAVKDRNKKQTRLSATLKAYCSTPTEDG